jgi:hypothetical protein
VILDLVILDLVILDLVILDLVILDLVILDLVILDLVILDLTDIFFPNEIALLKLVFPVDTPYSSPLAWALWMTSESSQRTRSW